MAIVGFDTFSEASANVALGSHTPDTGGGAGWSVEVAQFTVLFATDAVQHNQNALHRARKGDNIGDDNHTVTASLSVGGASRIAGVCARMSTDGYTNQYEAILQYLSTTQQDVKLFKNISGTRSQIGATVTITLAANTLCDFRLEIRTGTQQIFVDNVLTVNQTEPDATLAGRNYAGIIMNGNNSANSLITSFQSESVVDPSLAATLTGTGDLTAALTTNITMAASLVGTGDLTADLVAGGAGGDLGGVTLTGTGSLTAALTTDITLAATLTGTGDVTAALTVDLTLAVTLTGTGAITAALTVTADTPLAATLLGTGNITANLTVPASITLGAGLLGTGTILPTELTGGHVLLRFATYDIYVDNQLVELGVLDDTSVSVSLSDTYTGSKEFGGVTVRLGRGRPETAALLDNAVKGAGLRIYRYDATTTPTDVLLNGIFETFTGSLPNSWTLSGTGATSARDTTVGHVHSGASSVALTRVGNDAALFQDLVTAARPIAWWRGRTVTLTGFVRATVSGRAALAWWDGVVFVASLEHSGSGLFEQLTTTFTVSPTATIVWAMLHVWVGNTTAQFDDMIATYEQEGAQTLVFDGIINNLSLDTTALIVEGVQAPLKILEQKIPVALVITPWPKAIGSGAGNAVDIDLPVPDIFGNVPRSKCVYINRDRPNNIYDYLICKLRVGMTVPAMYRNSSSANGKEGQVSLIHDTEYTISAGVLYPGYLSARFPVEQIDFSGSDHTLYADVLTNLDQGITRNPARIIRTYLQEADQTIVDASFDAAEAEYTRLGYVMDFALTEQIQLQELVQDISSMLDAVLDRTSRGWTFSVDIRPTTVDYQFTEGTAELTPTIVDIGPLSLMPLMDEVSEIVLKYLPDLMDPSKYFGTVRRTLSTSTHASPLELTFPWIRSWEVADRIADYKAKQIRTRDRTVTITGPRIAAVPIRSLVLVTSPRRRLTDAIFMVKSLQQSILGQPELECIAWSPDPYMYEPGPPPADPVLGTFADFSRIPPAPITNITFPTGAPYEGVEIGPAGAVTAFVTVRFVTPASSNYAYAVIRYRVTSGTLWVSAGGPITQLGTVDVKIRNLVPGTSYDFSVQSFNRWGLTAGGDTGPAKVAPGDITAPAVPPTPVVSVFGRGLQISIIGYTPPTDFYRYRYYKGGVLWRETPANSQTDYDVAYGTTYQYQVLALDTSLPPNVSALSGIGSGTPAQIGGGDIQPNSIVYAHIQANQIGTAHIQANAITGAQIQANQINNAHIQANAIQTVNILAGNITNLTIDANAIGTINIRDDNVTRPKIPANTVSGASYQVLSPNQTLNATQGVFFVPGLAVSRTLGDNVGLVMLSFTGVWLYQNVSGSVVSAGVTVELMRDSAVVVSGGAMGHTLNAAPGPGNSGQLTVVVPIVDQPGAGGHTWSVRWRVQSTLVSTQVTCTLQQMVLEAVELKR